MKIRMKKTYKRLIKNQKKFQHGTAVIFSTSIIMATIFLHVSKF